MENNNELNFYWDKIGDRLRNLDKAEVKNIIADYYTNKIKVKDIIAKYHLNILSSQLIKEFPPIVVDEKCPYDNEKMVVNLHSRDGLGLSGEPYCPICGHQNSQYCRCKNCLEREKKYLEDLRNKVRDTYLIPQEKVEIDNLTLRDKLFLATVLKTGLNEETTKIMGSKLAEGKLSPLADMDQDVLSSLVSKNIILVDPESPLDAFVDENFPETYYIYKVNYLLNVTGENDNHDQLIGMLEYPKSEEFYSEPKISLGFWKELALAECKEFLNYRMKAVDFSFNPGKKTNLVLNNLLKNFSIGQIWRLIYISVAYAVQWQAEEKVPKKRAANSVITGLESRGQRAIADNWNLRNFGRNYNLPESMLARTLYDGILKIGNEGITEIPSIKLIDRGKSSEG